MILRTPKAFAAACCLVFAASGIAQTPGQNKTVAAPSASASVPVPAPITPNGVVVEDVIARVNDQIITRSDVERAQLQFDQESQGRGLSQAEMAEKQQNLLRDLIDQQLLLSKGKELGINADAQVITQLDDIRKQNHFATMEELEKAAQSQGVSFEDFKAQIRNNIITQSVVRDEVGRRLQLTHADVDKYYAEHKSDFTREESAKLSEILIATPENADDAAITAAKAKAEGIAAKLKAGAAFDDLARKESNGPTAAQGGDLGEFKRGALASVLEEKTFGKPAGTVTDPIRTRQGYVILKVTAYTPAGIQPEADVESQIEEAVYMQQMQPALRAYLTQLREEAYVDIKPGFVDTGASPKETKPVFTAYAPPQPKKKPEVATEKKRFDRHGHVITASATTAATVKPAVATSGPKPAKALKPGEMPKPARREKIRYGQAPRETLPAAPNAAAPAIETGSAQGTTSMMAEALPDPNAAPTTDPDPLGPHAGPKVKTRYAHEVPVAKAAKPKPTPIGANVAPPTTDETAAQKVQSAPLGLNGDTTKKKVKRKKGDKKERLEEKTAPTPAPQPAPTVNVPALNPGPSAMPSATTPPNAIPPVAQPPVAQPSAVPSPDAPPPSM